MSSSVQQVGKRAKYKSTVKDPGTPGVIKLVFSLALQPFQFAFTLRIFLYLIRDFHSADSTEACFQA